jgi:hypothetical protein
MSDHDRKKKDGQNKDKKNKAMREAVKERRDVRSTPSSANQPRAAGR